MSLGFDVLGDNSVGSNRYSNCKLNMTVLYMCTVWILHLSVIIIIIIIIAEI